VFKRSRPSYRVCCVSNVGRDSVREGDRGKGAAWRSEDASQGHLGRVVFAGDVALCESQLPWSSRRRRKTVLVWVILLDPFHRPSTTPVLSPWHSKCLFGP
jgi:hypothetical protein